MCHKKDIFDIVLLINFFFKTLLIKITHVHSSAKNKKEATSLSFLDVKSHLFVSNIGADIFQDCKEQAISDFEINEYSRTGKKLRELYFMFIIFVSNTLLCLLVVKIIPHLAK